MTLLYLNNLSPNATFSLASTAPFTLLSQTIVYAINIELDSFEELGTSFRNLISPSYK